MSEASSTKKCPFCAEEIKQEAVFCKHCKSNLVEGKKIDKEKVDEIKKDDKTSLIGLKGELSNQKLLIFTSEYEKKKKSSLVSYLLLLFFFGAIGSHQVYLGNKNKIKNYIGSVIIVFIGFALLGDLDTTGMAYFVLLFGICFWLYLYFGDLFTLGEQTKNVNENIELEILLSLNK